jgi:Aminoglycoside-2''-adenylyltransferase
VAEGISARQALAIYELLDRDGIRCWFMGGWGVDALLGRATRAHNDADDGGAVLQFHTDPWPLPPDTVTGRGTIEGVSVRCVTRAAQLAMHSVYELPDKHREDVRLLTEWI